MNNVMILSFGGMFMLILVASGMMLLKHSRQQDRLRGTGAVGSRAGASRPGCCQP